MKYIYLITSIGLMSSCMARKSNDVGAASLRTVTINQPNFKGEMRSTLTEEEKKKVFESLVYEIKVQPVKKDGKDDCNSGVVATTFDSGVQTIDKSTFENVKVLKGCNYVFSMKVGEKSEDAKSIKTLYLASADETTPSVLSKEELEKAKPEVAIQLYVTTEGKKYWDASILVPPTDSDVSVGATIAKKFVLTGEAKAVQYDKPQDAYVSSADFTPAFAAKKDMYCGVFLRFDNTLSDGSKVGAFMLVDGAVAKSIVKVDANVAAKFTVVGFVVKAKEPPVIKSAEARCSDSEAGAKAELDKALLGQ